MSWLCRIDRGWNEPHSGGAGEARAGRDLRVHHFIFSFSRRREGRSEEPVLSQGVAGKLPTRRQCLRALKPAGPWLGPRGRAEGRGAPELLVTLMLAPLSLSSLFLVSL